MRRYWTFILPVLLVAETAFCKDIPSGPAGAEEAFTALQAAMDGSSENGENTASRDEESRPEGGTTELLGRVLGGLIIVLGLLWVFVALLKRLTGSKTPAGGGGIKVLSKVSLSPKARLYLVEVAGSYLILGEAGGAVRTLHTFPVDQTAGIENERDNGDSGRDSEDDFSVSLGKGQGELERVDLLKRLAVGVRGLRSRRAGLP